MQPNPILWILSDKGTHVRFCWIPSYVGKVGNESFSVTKWDHWPWHWSAGKSSLCIFKVTNQLLYPAAGSNQVERVCTWQRPLPLETNIRATKERSVPNQSWGDFLSPGLKLIILRPQSPISPTTYQHCGQTLPIDHMLLAYAVLQEVRDGTTQLTLCRPTLRRFPRFALWNFYEKPGSIWLERSNILF